QTSLGGIGRRLWLYLVCGQTNIVRDEENTISVHLLKYGYVIFQPKHRKQLTLYEYTQIIYFEEKLFNNLCTMY
ncbi:MAG: hypothetical protein LBI80_04520, partial [Endomicrobium sp.]|nr:hypothetical protein [Endomicrobium sp.]